MFALQSGRRVSLWAVQRGAMGTLRTLTSELSDVNELWAVLCLVTISLGCRGFAGRVGVPFKTPEEPFG